MDFKKYIIDVPNFPVEGIIFRDITPVLESKFNACIEALVELYDPIFWSNVDCISGIESRGFIFGAALAFRLEKGFISIRKKGKLPRPAGSINFNLEYGSTAAEMNSGSGKILIVDDIIATGGTISACANLATEVGFNVVGLCAFIDLNISNGLIWNGIKPRVAVSY